MDNGNARPPVSKSQKIRTGNYYLSWGGHKHTDSKALLAFSALIPCNFFRFFFHAWSEKSRLHKQQFESLILLFPGAKGVWLRETTYTRVTKC